MLPPVVVLLVVQGHAVHPDGGFGPSGLTEGRGLGVVNGGDVSGAKQEPLLVGPVELVVTTGTPMGVPPLICVVVTVRVVVYWS